MERMTRSHRRASRFHIRPVGHRQERHQTTPHTHLHTNQARTDYQLGLGTNEGGPLGGLFARFEDPCNAIRFGQQCCINDREAEADTKPVWKRKSGKEGVSEENSHASSRQFAHSPLNGTHYVGRLQDQGKGDTVAHENPRQQDVAQLPTRGTHYGRVVVPVGWKVKEGKALLQFQTCDDVFLRQLMHHFYVSAG